MYTALSDPDTSVCQRAKPQLVSRQKGVVSMWCVTTECWCHSSHNQQCQYV